MIQRILLFVADTGSNPQLRVDMLADNGSYSLKCFDNKKEKEKGVYKSKDFQVKSIKGNLYIEAVVSKVFTAYCDGQFIGKANNHHLSVCLPYGIRNLELVNEFGERKFETITIHDGFQDYLTYL